MEAMETPQNENGMLSPAKTSENPAATLLGKDERVNFSETKCNDLWAAILFYFQIFGIIALSFANAHEIDWDQSNSTSDAEYMVIFTITIFTGLLGAYLYLNLLRTHTKCTINTAIIMNIVIIWVCFFYLLFAGQMVAAIFMGLGAAASVFYWWYIQSRIPFTVALIEIGIQIIDENSVILWAAGFTILAQAAFIIVWAIAFIGYGESTKEEGDSSWKLSTGMLFAFVLSGFWTFETIRYVLYSTACGVTASWFFNPEKPSPTYGAFLRAAVYSFGSIAFGGLLIAIVKTLDVIVRYAASQNDADNILAQILVCCVLCILSCLQDILEYLNEFGFAFVAIYGMTYCEAAKSVWELIKSTGFESIFQHDLTGIAIGMGCLLTGLLTFVCVFAFADLGASKDVKDNSLVISLIALATSFGIAYVALMIIVGAVTTTFIVWAMDPRSFFVNRPQAAQKVSKATEGLPNVSLDTRHLNPQVESA